MGQTDVSAIRTPRVFIAIAVVLLFARLAMNAASAFAPPEPKPAGVTWKNAADFESLPPKDASRKLVMYEFYANWSDPCKRMEATALNNKQISALIEKNFVPVRVTDRLHEDGKNPQWISDLQKKYRVFALPTLVVVDEQGEQVASLIGSCSSLSTYRFISRAIKPAKPECIAPVSK
jgi:thiol:disulfide interchange protein